MLSLIADALPCALLRLTPFAGDLFTTLDEILLPVVDDADAACRRHEQAEALTRRRAALAEAAERLLALGAHDARGPCTALPQAIQRALVRSQHVLVVSVGVPACMPPPTVTTAPADGHVLFLLVPSGDVGAFDLGAIK